MAGAAGHVELAGGIRGCANGVANAGGENACIVRCLGRRARGIVHAGKNPGGRDAAHAAVAGIPDVEIARRVEPQAPGTIELRIQGIAPIARKPAAPVPATRRRSPAESIWKTE